DALFAADPLGNRMGQDMTARWTLEAAYGIPAFGERFIGAPTFGYGASDFGRDMSLGWQLEPDGADAPDLTFGLKLSRREKPPNPPEHGFGIEMRTRW
ncbi:MAG: hypothetical protein OXH52_07255, partial [Gammaproteobacteria bacterium]|nr:hypothetical protein [Gammaproteobacteria bacterium]